MDEKELAKREMFDGNRKAIPERRGISKESSQWTEPDSKKLKKNLEFQCLNEIYFRTVLIYMQLMVLRRRRWHPTPVLLPGKSHGRRSLVGCSPGCR